MYFFKNKLYKNNEVEIGKKKDKLRTLRLGSSKLKN